MFESQYDCPQRTSVTPTRDQRRRQGDALSVMRAGVQATPPEISSACRYEQNRFYQYKARAWRAVDVRNSSQSKLQQVCSEACAPQSPNSGAAMSNQLNGPETA
eukprot:4040950-Pleurochrysis_carterae.AAC.3